MFNSYESPSFIKSRGAPQPGGGSARTRRPICISENSPHLASMRADEWDQIARTPLTDVSEGRRLALGDLQRVGLVSRGHGDVTFPAGLIPLVKRQLERAGHWVTTPEVNYWRREASINYCTRLEQAAVTVTTGRGGSLLVAPNFDQQVEIVAAISGSLPSSNVLVIAADGDGANRLGKRLQQQEGRTVSWGSKRKGQGRNVLHVDSPLTLRNRSVADFEVIFWVGASALQRGVQKHLLQSAFKSIWFGLLERPLEALPALDALAIEAFFGPIVLNCSAWQDCMSQINVVWLPPAAYPAAREWSALERKRNLIWHNPHRNRRIATTAASLADGDQRALQAGGVMAVNDVVLPLNDLGGLTMALIVENVEHGRQLLKLLHGWELLWQPQMVLDFGEIPCRSIVTLAVADERRLLANAVIYAAGCGDQWIDGCGPAGLGLGDPMLVVDVADDADDGFKRQCRSRHRDYQDRGWNVFGSPPERA